jgi:hypothetical protein
MDITVTARDNGITEVCSAPVGGAISGELGAVEAVTALLVEFFKLAAIAAGAFTGPILLAWSSPIFLALGALTAREGVPVHTLPVRCAAVFPRRPLARCERLLGKTEQTGNLG